jgi:allophanate hydrolase
MLPTILDLVTLRELYSSGTVDPVEIVETIADRIAESRDPAIFITAAGRYAMRKEAHALKTRAPSPNSLPLWGIPFAIKDNIDAAGLPTTAACAAYLYSPAKDAHVVAKLRAAGAIVVGKTNLDQFATGLNGTRSPYGAPRSVFNSDYISGGSSSGSAVAVAAGLCAFALGTDTAGSGRVPAAFNNIVGIKPTPGRISTTGLIPACRTLDCITIFSATVGDGVEIRRIAEGFDPLDVYSHVGAPVGFASSPLRVGVLTPDERVFFGDHETERLYDKAIARLPDLGAVAVPFDYAPFREVASLLYNGPWVAERVAAIEGFVATNARDLDRSVRGILQSAERYTAVDAFRGRYKLEAFRRRTEATWAAVDVLLLPTAPATYTVAAMRADPIRLNSHLGQYTNFANLLGLAAIAVPAGFKPDGLPAGVTLVGPGSSDDALAPLADALHRACYAGMGVDTEARLPAASRVAPAENPLLPLAVVGAHLEGLALNHQLTDLGAKLTRAARTTGDYKLYALPGSDPARPGLVRAPGFEGPGLEVEIWSLEPPAFARFTAAIAAPLGIGKVTLDDGASVPGFLCEAHAVEGARDITEFGGWRGYLAACGGA